MRTEQYMTSIKIGGSLLYSFISTAVVLSRNDSYEAVFSDIFFWAAAFLGTSLMLLVEKADPKTKEKVTLRRVLFSIMACLSIVFFAGTVRASMIEDENFERNHWFYGIVMFLCAIAPEAIRLIVTDGGKAVAKGFNEGVQKRVKRIVGGDSPDEDEPLDNYNNEQ